MKVEFKVDIDYEKYGGKHIAILDNETIVASGEDFKKVWEEAKNKYPEGRISFMHVRKSELCIPTPFLERYKFNTVFKKREGKVILTDKAIQL